MGSPRPKHAKRSGGEGGVGVPHTAIRISVRKAGERPIHSRDVEGRRGGSMGLQHVSYACGSVVVLGGEPSQEGLRLVVQGSIVRKLRGKTQFRTNRKELQDGIRVARIELLRNAKQRVGRSVVGSQHRQVVVFRILLCMKRSAFPSFVDDATLLTTAKWACTIPHAEVSEPLSSGTHGEALRREDKRLGRRHELGNGSSMGILVQRSHLLKSSAVGSQKGSMRLSGKSIDHGSDVLVWDVHQVEGEVGRPRNSEVGSDIAAVLGNRSDQQAHRTRSTMALVSPFAPACSTTGRARLHVRRRAAIRDGSQESHLFI